MVNKIYQGNTLEVLKTLPDEFIDCVVTSPPYWALRDYGVKGQLGLEPTFQEYTTKLCDIFDEVKRVLKKSGTCWVNMGDTYSGNKEGKTDAKVANYVKDTCKGIHKKAIIQEKCLCQIPSRFSIEMCNRGWILRNTLIWHKPNCMPSSVRDRFTVDYEYMFFFVKNKKYWFETQREGHNKGYRKGTSGSEKMGANINTDIYKGSSTQLRAGFAKDKEWIGRNKRCVWKITTKPFKHAHFAVFPEELVETPIKAGCPEGGIVLDPFAGSGTVAVVAKRLNRQWIGIELNPKYIKMAEKRIKNTQNSMF